MDVAIICSAIPARKELLKRSMLTWSSSILASGLKAKIFLYLEDLAGWEGFIPVNFVAEGLLGDCVYMKRSGSHIAGYNYWLEQIKADKFIFTHPDLLFPMETVSLAYKLAIPDRFVAFKVYWMPEGMTNEIEKYDWRTPTLLENEKDLFPIVNFSDNHGDFYWNSDVRNKKEWHSTTTWAMDKATVEKLRPFPDFETQGPDDLYFATARAILKIEDYCVMNPILFHQHHPQTWNQDAKEAIELATKELQARFG